MSMAAQCRSCTCSFAKCRCCEPWEAKIASVCQICPFKSIRLLHVYPHIAMLSGLQGRRPGCYYPVVSEAALAAGAPLSAAPATQDDNV